ncbi:hypothetical protein BO94DRAFT_573950 [Aspergillus sclerotioniger CBS 115572]|uniref:Alpha-ketoglutarate-dependent dioxygenase AlkB-like domain-containing protein n=1 Tax=Aspergillus sclerotioniger CBS 115572 TaxID=1450535 RepID=A0A317WYS9_9EURO|nr:hypothetical protein BO94DRAFT_573950 [Aspergillus sclerotioniger CBS 115572]PWY91529.1 hypothetical protein BO94DRAFT_573950 [Aspergillus sclerotioniger CBS 115572]
MGPRKPAKATSRQAPPVISGRITRSKTSPRTGGVQRRTPSVEGRSRSRSQETSPATVEGQPPAWAMSRPELCDALPWFRAVQGGVYHSGNLCLGFLIDADFGIGSYADEEIIITRADSGGGCTKDAEGNLVLLKDQDDDSSAISSIANSMKLRVPVGLIIGDRNTLLDRKPPHRYNVMAYFRITHLWYEKIGRKTGAKVRFQKLDLSQKSWWATKDPPLLEERDFDLQPAQACCAACGRASPQVYEEGWMCLRPSCDRFWTNENASTPSQNLSFHPDFLRARLPPDLSIQPHYSLVPDLLSTFTESDGDVLSRRIAWKGIVCPQCARCISRTFWWGWKCADISFPPGVSHECTFEKMLGMRPVSLRSVIEELEMSPIKRALSFDPKFMVPEIDDRTLYPYRKLTYEIPGVGSITHLVSNRAINTRPNGPDDLFKQLQVADLGLRRYPLERSVVGGTLTAHFAVNYGMPYKYVVSVATKGFDEACDEILRALGRLTWATEQAVTNAGDCFLPPNELLVLGYFEDMKIRYHDDGESSLGPTVATLSLGAKSTMLIRMKYKYYHGYSKSKKVLSEDPVLEGCEDYARRQDLKSQLTDGSINQTTDDELRSGPLTKGRGGEASPCIKMELNHGDLVVMHGKDLQKYYEHSVIPEKRLRFALTARHVKPEQLDATELEKGQFSLLQDQVYDGK